MNAPKLYGEQGQSGHYVVVYGADDKQLFLHDPGLPAKSAQKVADSVFDGVGLQFAFDTGDRMKSTRC